LAMENRMTRPGKERRKAWMYSVINPLLNGLEIEKSFLARKNWTFRRYNRDLEFIRPVRALVDFQSRPNLDDFVTSNPTARGRLDDRDARREDLRKACNAAFEALVSVVDFQRKVSECLNTFVKETARDPASIFNPNIKPYEGVAEIIINNVAELPDHYGPHQFWSRFRDELMPFRRGQSFQHADRAGAELDRSDQVLSAVLTKLRSNLAKEYDIPWAPYSDESLSLSRR